MENKKMMLGGAGPSQLGVSEKKLSDTPVQVVSSEQASMRPNKSEQIDTCCGASPLKMKGMGK